VISGATSPRPITGLATNTQYAFRVCALNSNPSPDVSAGVTSTQTTLSVAPTLTVSEPNGTGDTIAPGTSSYNISLTGADTDDAATIDLYYNTVSTNCSAGLTGWTSIVTGLAENTTTHAWNTTALTAGTYYVCGVITGGSTSVYAVSPGALTVQAGFVSTWKTDNAGTSTSTQITLPLVASGTYNFVVDWGDSSTSTITAWNDAAKTHTYASAGTKTVTITGTITGWQFNNGGDKLKMLTISSWGPFKFGDTGYYFYGASNLTITATDVPDMSGTTDMRWAFYNCLALTTVPSMNNWDMSSVTNMLAIFANASLFNQNIGSWNTANVTDMTGMFIGAAAFNQNIELWNTSNVTKMAQMFSGASTFNQNVGTWNTTNVTTMSAMFQSTTAFNQNIGSWNTANVTNMNQMFNGASAFNQNIGSWNTSNVTKMTSMFQGASVFNQNIGSWNTTNVTAMDQMFSNAIAFNQNIGTWNTGNVTNMSSMLSSAVAFNQDIGSWNTANVTNMSQMFINAALFNQNISSWNTASVTTMASMFFQAYAFNQNIGTWNTSSVTSMSGMFRNVSAFNQNLASWDTSKVSNMSSMFYGVYCPGSINTFSLII
jgi:surface protein